MYLAWSAPGGLHRTILHNGMQRCALLEVRIYIRDMWNCRILTGSWHLQSSVHAWRISLLSDANLIYRVSTLSTDIGKHLVWEHFLKFCSDCMPHLNQGVRMANALHFCLVCVMIWSGSIWSDKMALQIKQGVNVAQVMIRLFPFSDVMIGLHLHLPQTLRFADDPCLWIVYRFHMPLFWTNSGSMIKYFFYNQDSCLWILSYVWITQNNSSEQSIICMTVYYSIILSEMSSLMRSVGSSVGW